MLSNNMKFSLGNQVTNEMYNSTHNDEYSREYGKYSSHTNKLSDQQVNSSNLFDDSNTKDRKWVNLAKKYLAKSP